MKPSEAPATGAEPAALIIAAIRAAGMEIGTDPTDPDKLRVSPPGKMTPDLRAGLVANRPAILEALRAEQLPRALAEDAEERAAIIEHEADVPRAEAVEQAVRRVWCSACRRNVGYGECPYKAIHLVGCLRWHGFC